VPGDPVAAIDWYASARVSSARASEEFLVRERFADEAPAVVVVRDRRPEMALYAAPLPWLSKPMAAEAAQRAIVASARAARADVGYVDGSEWLGAGGRGQYRRAEERSSGLAFDAPPDGLERALRVLLRHRAGLAAGAFVFLLSDFLAPPSSDTWRRLRSLRWDVVPVVIQDPVFEQSFPVLPHVVVPVADPATGRVREVRLRRSTSAELRRRHERRLADLLRDLRRRGHDPVLLGTSDPVEVLAAFLAWAGRRERIRGRR